MIDNIPPVYRLLLARCRSWAMRGHLSDSLDSLNQALTHEGLDLLTHAALLSTKAELLYLDARYEESYAVFRDELDVLSEQVPTEVGVALGYNRSSLAAAMNFAKGGLEEHYALIDRSNLLGLQLEDANSLLEAVEHAARQQSYDSLPTIWRELLRTYYQGCWRAHKTAYRHMADECLRIGCFEESAHHAMLAREKNLTARVANALLKRDNPSTVRAALTRLMVAGNLAKHFIVACELIKQLFDVIPDDQVDAVVDWMLIRATDTSLGEAHNSAWEALAALAPRLQGEVARKATRAAVSHPTWNQRIEQTRIRFARGSIIEVVGNCADQLVPMEIGDVARASLALLFDLKSDLDYSKAVNLVCHLAKLGGGELKDFLGGQIYQPGRQLDALLAQVGDVFGKQVATSDELAKLANRIADDLSLQVQVIPLEAKPKEVLGTMLTMTAEDRDKGRKIVAHITNNVHLGLVTVHRRRIEPVLMTRIVENLLDCISNEWNPLANRSALAWALRDWGDSLTDETANRAFTILAPLASGNVGQILDQWGHDRSNHPRSRNKMDFGKLSEVQGASLFALASIERDKPGIYGRRIMQLVEATLLSRNAEVRKFACWSAKVLPSGSGEIVSAILMGTRDSNEDVSRAAFDYFVTDNPLKINGFQRKLLIHSLSLTIQSPSNRVRSIAARVVKSLLSKPLSLKQANRLKKVRQSFERDFYWSVRQCIVD